MDARAVGEGLSAGATVQTVYQDVTTFFSGNSNIPLDNTIPQITEGGQVHTLNITPKYANSVLEIEVNGAGYTSGGGSITMAVFKNSGSNAVAAIEQHTTSPEQTGIRLLAHVSAGSTSTATYTVRVGATGGTGWGYNGRNGAAAYGGVGVASMVIREIKQ